MFCSVENAYNNILWQRVGDCLAVKHEQPTCKHQPSSYLMAKPWCTSYRHSGLPFIAETGNWELEQRRSLPFFSPPTYVCGKDEEMWNESGVVVNFQSFRANSVKRQRSNEGLRGREQTGLPVRFLNALLCSAIHSYASKRSPQEHEEQVDERSAEMWTGRLLGFCQNGTQDQYSLLSLYRLLNVRGTKAADEGPKLTRLARARPTAGCVSRKRPVEVPSC